MSHQPWLKYNCLKLGVEDISSILNALQLFLDRKNQGTEPGESERCGAKAKLHVSSSETVIGNKEAETLVPKILNKQQLSAKNVQQNHCHKQVAAPHKKHLH